MRASAPLLKVVPQSPSPAMQSHLVNSCAAVYMECERAKRSVPIANERC